MEKYDVIIIGGGPCAYNAEPVADFFDLFNIGEGEELLLDISNLYMKMKEEGRIKHLGFSTHGTLDTMRRFLDKYGKYMEFCQLQINWLDYSFQNAKAKIEMMN